MVEYMWQIFMRRGTTEYSLAVLFDMFLTAARPLGGRDMLGDPEFAVPFSFVFGDGDWVRSADGGSSEKLIQARKASDPNSSYKYHLVPHSDHNMHMDNPAGFASAIIADLVE